ncbi:probable LRR receptor-like serine threonine-kinase At1g06840 isoform X1 [Olea europaea subsp. europaea]|uniref:non-specific serine/threonine protein kinase n=1 Tax=Olea europaea subsp. europaea TaxID=158383 RepID=A0A8S0UDJ2_OLEEU|nr:probable LRR receptor-like serine threonine-kinase At1g06840 isoform X1 [Olea europaea subsp. europaea]
MAQRTLYFIAIFLACFSARLAYAQQITDPREVSALLAVRSHLTDPWKNLGNWDKKKDPCTSNWKGVICYPNSSDGYMHIQELRLMHTNLSGILAPELGRLVHMKRLNFMWNNISGSIPKEIGNIPALELLLLSGNQLSGPLPDELGHLPNLNIFQLDRNQFSGSIPKSFVNLLKVQHFHMNNNSLSGQLPPELSALPLLQHFLLDNNKLAGHLPPEYSQMPNLTIFQLNNNSFEGSVIPDSYGNMSKLIKLSLRNCNLRGKVPDLSGIRSLLYLDLSKNQLTGNIPVNRLSNNITTINLSKNQLNGSIPSNFSGLPRLQKLRLNNNLLSGSVPSTIWKDKTFTSDSKLEINFQDNLLSDISGVLEVPPNVTLKLHGNPVCENANQRNIGLLCGSDYEDEDTATIVNKQELNCPSSCPTYYEHIPGLQANCICANPFGVGLRLRSPSMSDFPLYRDQFSEYITGNIKLYPYQLFIDSLAWEEGPRLRMFLKFFPKNDSNEFNKSEIQRIADVFTTFTLPGNDKFGPYELLNFTANGPYFIYFNVQFPSLKGKGMSKGALAGIVLGSIFCASMVFLGVVLLFLKKNQQLPPNAVKDKSPGKVTIIMDGVKAFSFKELQAATSRFSIAIQVGEGGYGKVFKGTLADGTVVAIKRAQQGSLQGDKEFYTEIEILSRLHHRNLVSLVGYCDEDDEQMLVYEFMPNGSLHDLLSARDRSPLSFATRLHIALGSARGILYLHTEADPPIIHRDIKSNNILLDSKWTAKVSDFGISRLAPVSDVKGATEAHISTNVKGTPGYLDPEYFLTHKLTEKSDVYSLGVVFLELLTGMQPISHGRNLVREVNMACQSGTMFSIIDESMGPYPLECIKKFMQLAIRCSQDETKGRPSMLEVVRELENISSVLPECDNTALELHLNTVTSECSASAPSSSVYSTYISNNLPGSNLDSDVLPTIKPR